MGCDTRSMVYSLLAVSIYRCSAYARNIYHFGDSYSDTGFNYQGSLPSSTNLLGNPEFPGNTILGQQTANWIGMFIKDTQNSSNNPPLFYNYASSGSCVDQASEGCQEEDGRFDFAQQYTHFHTTQKGKLKYADDLVSIYFGTNDVNAMRKKPMGFKPTLDRMFDIIEQMYTQDGARRFLIFGMDPIWRVPGYAVEDLAMPLKVAGAFGVFEWNLQLSQHVLDFKARHGSSPGADENGDDASDLQMHVLDTLDVFNRVLDDPQSHGAQDSTCIINQKNDGSKPSACLWHDDLHPGAPLQQALVDAYAAELRSMNFLQSSECNYQKLSEIIGKCI